MPLLPLTALLLVVAVGVGALARIRPDDATNAERAAQRHIDRFAWAALALWILTIVAVCASIGAYGRGVLVAPAAAGAVAMVVLAVGERTVPTEEAPHLRVDLTPRAGVAQITRSTVALTATTLAALIALLALAWSKATADEFGHTGRGVEWATRDGSQSHGPWPGSYYSIPMVIALLVLAAAFAVAMYAVALRPQLNADTDAAVADVRMRARSAHTMQGVFLITLGATLLAVAACMALATSFRDVGSPQWVTLAHWGGLAGALVGAAAIVRGVWLGVTR